MTGKHSSRRSTATANRSAAPARSCWALCLSRGPVTASSIKRDSRSLQYVSNVRRPAVHFPGLVV